MPPLPSEYSGNLELDFYRVFYDLKTTGRAMLEQLSIHELIQSVEQIDGQILIPDEEAHWLWDTEHHQYYDMSEEDRAIIVECFQTTRIQSKIRTVTREDHSAQFVQDIFIPIVRDYGASKIILKFSFDVTDKIIAERKISEDRDKLANIARNAPDAIIMLDETVNIISWNKGAEMIFGYEDAEMRHQPIEKLFHSDNVFSKILESHSPAEPHWQSIKQATVRCVSKSGRDIFCELTLMFLQNKDVRETVILMRDKTQQKLLEDESQRTLENLSKINEISALIHASLDLDEILNMILVAATAGQGLRFNRAFLFLMNDEKTSLDGKKAIGPSDPHEAGILWTELAQKTQTLNDILKSYKATQDGRDFKVNQMITALHIPVGPSDNEYRAFSDTIYENKCILISPAHPDYLTSTLQEIFQTDQLAIVPLISKDEPLGVLVVDNAITGRAISDQDIETLKIFAHQIVVAIENAVLYDNLQKKVEELEEAHQSLKDSQERLIRSEKLAAIGELSAKMAHEIRNPLVAIGGFARAMLHRKHYKTSEEYLKVIVNETMRLEHILNDTLTYVRSVEPVKQKQSIRLIVDNALALLSERFKTNNIMVKTEFQNDLPDCDFDAEQISQAILNILINADEAMPTGGELSLKLFREEDFVHLRISDTGEGIDLEHMNKIFDPFFTTKQKGSGLGLVIVHDIFERHGISYEVTSEKQKGTVFSIKLKIN
jgi:PAS domain S-box-containing protein